MVGKSVKFSSENTSPVEIISQALASKSLARNLKSCSNKRASSRRFKGEIAEDLSDISDAEVAGYLNNKEQFLMKKIAWEMMNPNYLKEKKKNPNVVKKKKPANKIAQSKKNTATDTAKTAEIENRKKLSSLINYDYLEKIFDVEDSPKRAEQEKPVAASDQKEHSLQSSEDRLLKLQSEEEAPDSDEVYCNEDEEIYADPELEDQYEGEDYAYNDFEDEGL